MERKIFQQEIEIAAGFEANCPGTATERGLGIHKKIKMSLWQRIRPESQSSDLGEMKCFCL
jgi:hypothetical protein